MAVLRGRPFLEWQLISLREAGLKDILLCTGYMARNIREYFGGGKQLGLRITYSDEPEPRGTGGALRSALSNIQTDPVLVLNGDSWCNVDIASLVDFHVTCKAIGTLALTVVANPERYGQVRLGKNAEIVDFVEKSQSCVTGWINAGLYVLSRSVLSRIPENACLSLEHDIFPQLVHNGLYGYWGEHQFFDIGTPTSYAQAEQEFEHVFHGVQDDHGVMGMMV
ncbi:MAG: hypothetical protein NPIRA02_03250 [Nitrospirales bacterium]|nr:MAG: hypothetical protein NPIRA02_03250 [Nitrospirales bacterium]